MADLSLDAYIAKSSQASRPMRGGLGNRLGPKAGRGGSRGRGSGSTQFVGGRRGGFSQNSQTGGHQNPQFNVVGLGKVRGFDARQKLSNPLKTAVQDAREKIRPKNFDARRAIETKKEQKQGLDVRSRIEINKAKKVDARQKINNARMAKTQSADPKVTVTGGFRRITPPGANPHEQEHISMTEGSLVKTIRSAPPPPKQIIKQIRGPSSGQMTPLTRTVDNPPMRMPPQSSPHSVVRSSVIRSPTMRPLAMGSPPPPSNNLVITKRNTAVTRPSQHPPPSRNTISLRGIRSQSSEQWTGTESTLRSASSTGTVVSVKNDMYQDEEEEDMRSYSHLPARSTSHQPVQPGAVWDAIQSVNTKRTPEPPTVPVTDTVSPLQGYRVLVTNLHPIVTEDDIIELFGAVGALKKARLIKPGTAEVVFVTKEEAHAAVRKYHLRELDGLPMQLVLTSRGGGPEVGAATAQRPITTQPSPNPQSKPTASGPLRLAQLQEANGKQSSMSVDPNLIHKALFKTATREEAPVRPVTFTVKI